MEMRTTVNIDGDLLIAVKEIAKKNSESMGAVISRILRNSLTGSSQDDLTDALLEPGGKSGIPSLRSRGGVVSSELVYKLQDEAAE